MNPRALFTVLALPMFWVLAAFVPAGTEDKSAPAKAEVAKPMPAPYKISPLRDACDLLRDYFGSPAPAAEPDRADRSVSLTVSGKSGKATLTGKFYSKAEKPNPGDCVMPPGTSLNMAFVMIPDPTASALALETDRALDAIRLAMGSDGFVPYRTNTLPWRGLRGVEHESKGEEAVDLAHPGVWLFRSTEMDHKPAELKLLFLIGDSPTIGISKAQFANAVEQFTCLKGGSPLKIVGPVFSGSMDSLAYALSSLNPGWEAKITSGTADVRDLSLRLQAVLGDKAKNVSLDQLAKRDGLNRMLDVLDGKTAILSEGDTLFGQRSRNEEQEKPTPVVFRYSRNLLNLRKAYESDTDLMGRIFPKSIRPDQLALHFGSERDPIDALPTYEPKNLALSQQLGLKHLAGNLRRRKFANLVIVGSDNIDSVFLARFFQEENPNLRIAMVDSDALLDRYTGSVSLRGVLTISQQPTGVVAMDTIGGEHIELPDGVSFGIYRACRKLLLDKVTDTEPNRIISVVGFNGEWPVKVLGPTDDCPQEEVGKSRMPFYFRWLPPTVAFFVLLGWLCFSPILIYAFRKHKKLLAFVPFCRPLALAEPVPAGDDPERLRQRWLWICFFTGAVAFGAPLVWGLAILFSAPSHQYPAIVARYFFFGGGVSPLLPLTALLLILHACAWCRVRSYYLQAYVFCPEPHPLRTSEDSKDGLEMKELLKAVKDHARVLFDRVWIVGFTIFGGATIFFYDLVIGDIELDLPGWLRKGLWTISFLIAGILIVNAASRVMLLWLSLQRLLRRLEFHPLRVAFTTLTDRVSWTSIWSLGGTRPTMVSLQMSADYLSAIKDKDNAGVRDRIDKFMGSVHNGDYHSSTETRDTLQTLKKDLAAVTTHFIEDLKGASSWNDQRIEGWQHKNESGEKGKEKGRDTFPLRITEEQGSLKITTPPADPSQRLHRLKAEFIALQYSAFIRYAFMELRNLLGFLVTASTLLFIALNVYPFQPMGALTNFATSLFVLAAIVVVTVFYQMDRDSLLSRLSNTSAGQLDAGFSQRLLQFGLLPTITFLAVHFPPIGQALARLVQIIPGLAKL